MKIIYFISGEKSKNMIGKILGLLSRKDKIILFKLFVFSILVSVVEIVGISAVMPFIQVVTNNGLIHENKYYSEIYKFFEMERESIFIIIFGMLLVFFYISRSFLNLFYVYSLASFIQSRYHFISSRLFTHYMESQCQLFNNKNSSEMTKNIVNEAQNLTQVISSVLFMISESFIFIFLYALMFYIDWRIAFSLTFLVALNALLMLKTISAKIKKIGIIRAERLTSLYENINSSFGNFKIIKLRSSIVGHVDKFKHDSQEFTRTNTINITLTNVPRLFLEAAGFSMVIFIISYLVWVHDGNIAKIMPTITIFVFSLYRLLPSLNRISTGYNEILFYRKSLDIINHELSSEVEEIGNDSIPYQKEIELRDVGFSYSDNDVVLEAVNLIVNKGTSIAFVGKSGSGKSTLVDVIMGLNLPNIGSVYADGVLITKNNLSSWRSKIGYIPQSVYLFDGTIGENVSFGMPHDEQKVDALLKKVRLHEFLETKNGQNTLVGENGSKLSGGQKQRVAIARALYSDAEILVLDEATSALDVETEKQIMNEIYDMAVGKTLIIIAHRTSTLSRCDNIYKITGGKIESV